MNKIYNLLDRPEFIEEYFKLCSREWGNYENEEELNKKVEIKTKKFLNSEIDNIISVLILVKNNTLVGFISLFKSDSEIRKDLSPWYATMYVKNEFRKKGYSKLLNAAIIDEAAKLGYDYVYLKTELDNYYEKFNAKLMGKLNDKEKLYYIETKNYYKNTQ